MLVSIALMQQRQLGLIRAVLFMPLNYGVFISQVTQSDFVKINKILLALLDVVEYSTNSS